MDTGVVIRASQILGSEVVSADGEGLGRVHDVRVRRRAGSSAKRADQQWRVVGLVIGERGLLERLGLASAKRPKPILQHELVPWESVERIDLERRRVIVRV
jgi:sporulation protein YlmC with PRC-barrel domain